MSKKIISIFLSSVIVISTMFCTNNVIFAASTTEYNSGAYKYKIINSKERTIEITKYNGTDADVYIPETIDGYTVINIGSSMFGLYRDSIKSITIPSTVENILCRIDSVNLQAINVDSNNKFYSSMDGVLYDKNKDKLIRVPYDYQVETFTVPNSVKIIGSYAFYRDTSSTKKYTTMLHINFPEGVEELENYAFYGARFEELVFPDSLRKIGNYVFNACYAHSMYFGSGLTEVGYQMFVAQTGPQTPRLKNIIVSPDNPIFSSIDGVFYGNCGKDLICYPQEKEGSKTYKVQDSVTYIHSCAFQYTSFGEIDLNNVTKIGECSFANCFFDSIILPEFLDSFDSTIMRPNVEIAVLNPKCKLRLDYFTSHINKITIRGYKNSTAEELVKNNTKSYVNYTFYSLGDYIASGDTKPSGYHKYIDVVIKPTCINEGYTKYVCTSCGDTYNDHYVEPLGHTPVIDNEIPVSCLINGLTSGSHCSRCNKVLIEQIEIKATGHSMDNGVIKTKATCTKNGEKVFSCKNCNYSYSVSISATAHKYTSKTIKANFNKAGSTTNSCSICGNVKSKITIAKIKSATLSKTSLTYTGKNLSKPTVTVKDSNGNKISSSNYTVTYISRSTGKTVSSIKNIGQYKIKVIFKGNFSGEKNLYFSVKPKKIQIKAPSTGSKYVTAKWTKDNAISGYQVVIATNSKFTKNKKTVTIKKNSPSSYKFTKLKKGSKYYIKVRSYKTIKVDGRTAKMYSDYSAVKSIKCK